MLIEEVVCIASIYVNEGEETSNFKLFERY